MLQLDKIAEGFYNNILKKEEDLYNERIVICKKCPLFKKTKIFGPVCNSELYINDKDEISKTLKPGFVKGCGCVLNSKTRLENAKCIINK